MDSNSFKLNTGDPMPKFSLKDVSGKLVSDSDLKES